MTFPPLLSSVTVGGIICRAGDLLGFVYGGLFDIISIHDHILRTISIRNARTRNGGRGAIWCSRDFCGVIVACNGSPVGDESNQLQSRAKKIRAPGSGRVRGINRVDKGGLDLSVVVESTGEGRIDGKYSTA